MEQSYYAPPAPTSSQDPDSSLQSAAAEFGRNVQEATGKLVAAAESFGAMSSGLSAAVNEVKSAAAQAREAKQAAEAARAAAEAVQAKMERDYGNLKNLMSDLQERIGALAVLARPFNVEAESVAQDERDTENSTPPVLEEAQAAAENAPSPAGWQGWRG